MRFTYQAQTAAGERVQGTEEAVDRFALARAMHARGLFLITASPSHEGEKKHFWQVELGRVSRRELILFTGNLSVLLSAGLTLSRSLEVLRRQTKKKYFQNIIVSLGERIAAGDNLHKALGAYPQIFPPVVVAMSRAGEGSGTLANSLKLSAAQLTKAYEVRRKVKGALIYPAVILAAIVVIAALMMIFLVPTLVATFNDLKVELPLATQVIVLISNFLTNYWLVALLGFILIVAAIYYFLRTLVGRLAVQYVALRLPGIGRIVGELNAAVLMRTISSLLSAGVGMVETLEITAGVVQNLYFRRGLLSAARQVETGVNLSGALKARAGLYPILVSEMAEVGEETGDLSGMLLKGAEFYEGEVEQATKNLSTIIEPLLMIIVGIAVGLFAYSMIGPLYSISDAF